MILRDLIAESAEKLKRAGVPDPEYDARELYLRASGDTLSDYAGKLSEEVPEKCRETFMEMTGRRAGRIPLQQITGLAPFYGRELRVNEDVLIPRFDTETLVEAALLKLQKAKERAGERTLRILDLCTGSGCILITLLLEGPEGTEGVGSDISDGALRISMLNAKRLSAKKASFIKSDLFCEIHGTYDLITANPPYIRTCDIEGLDEEVKDHEPYLSLDGGADGLSFYRRIVSEAGAHLRGGGCLALEIGCTQSEEVRAMMEEAGFSDIEVKTDLAGLRRAVLGEYGHVG